MPVPKSFSHPQTFLCAHIQWLPLAAAYLLVRAPYLGFVPLWDGAVFYWFARYPGPGITAVEPHGHVSFLFMWLISVPARLAGAQVGFFNFFLLVFTAAGIYAFHQLLEMFTGKAASRWETALFTAVFAFHPTVLSNTINVNLDQGLLTFFLLFLLAYLKERYAAAAIFALLLIFTKESGLLLLCAALAAAILCYPRKRSAESLKATSWMIAFCMGCFGAYAWYKTQMAGQALFWQGLGDTSRLFQKFIDLPAVDGYLRVQLAQLFVLNFQWVPTTVLFLTLAMFPATAGKKASQEAKRNILFCGVLGCTVFFLLCRFYPYSNARYLLVLFPVSLLLLDQLLVVCVTAKHLRLGLNALFLTLFALSLHRSVDPVTNRIFGTFDFGEHKMLKMTRIAGDCCGYGRDQLVYNLQFTQFHYVQNLAFEQIKPGPQTVVLASREAWPAALMGPLREDDHHRTTAGANVVRPVYETVEGFRQKAIRSEEVYYMAFPNVDNRRQIDYLASLFARREDLIFKSGGYALEVVRFHND